MNGDLAFFALFGRMLLIKLPRVAPPFGARITGEPIARPARAT